MFPRRVRPGKKDTSKILSAKFQNLSRSMYMQQDNLQGHQTTSKRAGMTRIESPQVQPDFDIVFVRNDTYYDLRQFDVVTLGPSVTDTRSSYADESNMYTEGTKFQALPQAPYRSGQTAVLMEPVSRCSYGRAVIAGGTWVNGALPKGTYASTGLHDAEFTPRGESEVTLAANLFGETMALYSDSYYGSKLYEHARECYVLESVDNGSPDPDTACQGNCTYECKNERWVLTSESCSGDCRCQVGPGTPYDGPCTDGDTAEDSTCASWPMRRSHIRIGQLQNSVYQMQFLSDRDRDTPGLCRYICSSGSWTLEYDGSIIDEYTCMDAADIPESIFPCEDGDSGCSSVLKLPPVIDFDNQTLFFPTSTSTTAAPTSTTTADPSCLNKHCLVGNITEPYLAYSGCHSWYGPDRRCYCEFPELQPDGTWGTVGREVRGIFTFGTGYISQCKAATCSGKCYWRATERGWLRINDSPCAPWCECPMPDEPAELYRDQYDGYFVTVCGQEVCKPCETGYCKWVTSPDDGSWSLDSNTCPSDCSCNPNPPTVALDLGNASDGTPITAAYYRKCCSNTITSTTTVNPSTTTPVPALAEGCTGQCSYICEPGGWRITHEGCFPHGQCMCPEPSTECEDHVYDTTETVNCGSTTTTTTTTTTLPPTTTTTSTTSTTTTEPPTTTTSTTTSTSTTSTTEPPDTTTTTTTTTTTEPPETTTTTTTTTLPP